MPDLENGIETKLGELRLKRGLSAIGLAAAIGVSRQTIYAMEAGTFVPNTAVALRLAKALDATVEELFALSGVAPAPALHSEQVMLLPDSALPQAGQAVQLCRVNRKLIASTPSMIPWHFPAADAVVSSNPERFDSAQVQVFQTGDFSNRILVAGCDPGISVLSRHVQAAGVELVLAHRNSSQSLALLKQGCVHIAGTHLKDEASGESNLQEIGNLFPKRSVAAITFAVWEEGIVSAKGNPKNIKGVADFARKDVAIVNREAGSGSRALLDARLKQAGVDRRRVQGYNRLASGHLSAAWEVSAGLADCCIATQAAARMFGLSFLPLATERYDLAIRKQHLELPKIQHLFDILSRSGLRRELEGLGGYDMSASGKRVL